MSEKIPQLIFQIVEIKMQVQYMSFSAHADAKGIMQLIRMCEPENVMLVHGEAAKMEFLKSKINKVSKHSLHLHQSIFLH